LLQIHIVAAKLKREIFTDNQFDWRKENWPGFIRQKLFNCFITDSLFPLCFWGSKALKQWNIHKRSAWLSKKKNSTWFYTNSRCDKETIVAESKHFIDKSSHTIYRLKQSGKIPGD